MPAPDRPAEGRDLGAQPRRGEAKTRLCGHAPDAEAKIYSKVLPRPKLELCSVFFQRKAARRDAQEFHTTSVGEDLFGDIVEGKSPRARIISASEISDLNFYVFLSITNLHLSALLFLFDLSFRYLRA